MNIQINKEITVNTEEEKKKKTQEEKKKKASEEKKKRSEEKKKKFTDAYTKLESEKKQLKEENIKLKDELLNLNDAYDSQLESIKEELRQEKARHQVHKKLLADKICECDDLTDKLRNQKPKSRKKKEAVIEYIETIKIHYESDDYDTEEDTFIGYGLPDAKSYIEFMKIKELSEILDICEAYSHKSLYMKELLTESPQDEKWIIKKTSRTTKTTHTEEEIKKQEEGIDFNINCQSCIYNGSKNNMRPCKRTKTIMRGTHRICNAHNKTADAHLQKYMNWTVEMGTHYGWYGEEETYHQDHKTTKNPDYRPPARK